MAKKKANEIIETNKAVASETITRMKMSCGIKHTMNYERKKKNF